MQAVTKLDCDWCKSTNTADTGGREWSGHSIYVCKDCSHEWVETRLPAGESKFFDNMDQIIEDFRKEEKKKPQSED